MPLKNPAILGTVLNQADATNSGFYPSLNLATASVKSYSVDATVVVSDFPKILNNTGAADTVTLTLPDPQLVNGKTMVTRITTAQILRLKPPIGSKIFLTGGDIASKYLEIPAVVGNYVGIYSNGSSYQVTSYSGALTKEP